MEEKNRGLNAHAGNELIHIDAGAYGESNGNRVLRFFINVNPQMDRVWASKGSFPELLETYGEQADLGYIGPGKATFQADHWITCELDLSTSSRVRYLNSRSCIPLPMTTSCVSFTTT